MVPETTSIPGTSKQAPKNTNHEIRNTTKHDNTSNTYSVAHNVLNWRGRRLGLTNIYRNLDADVILLNSHGTPEHEPPKIPGYRTHTKNYTNRPQDGTAIAVKNSITQDL